MRTYAQEMTAMDALPNGAAETASIGVEPPVATRGWLGRKGARCLATQMGLGKALSVEYTGDWSMDILPDTWTTTTVRTNNVMSTGSIGMRRKSALHRKGFVKVHMANIPTTCRGIC